MGEVQRVARANRVSKDRETDTTAMDPRPNDTRRDTTVMTRGLTPCHMITRRYSLEVDDEELSRSVPS